MTIWELRDSIVVHEHPVKSIVNCAWNERVLYVHGELTHWERFLCYVFGVIVSKLDG